VIKRLRPQLVRAGGSLVAAIPGKQHDRGLSGMVGGEHQHTNSITGLFTGMEPWGAASLSG